jgi:lipopolysaccharide heptosyltransferase II
LSKKMKILQILPELNVGGVERGTVDLARELLERGHQALVVSAGGALVQQLESAGAKHFRLPVHKKSLFTILTSIPRLVRILQREKVDIVHARSRVPALIAFLACRRTGTNFLTTCHGYYSRHFFSRIMGWGRLVIVASRVIAWHMMEDFGVPKERIRSIPRGVDLEEFSFHRRVEDRKDKTGKFTIGVIGRLTPIKGHKYFLQALAKVIRIFPQAQALIVGEASTGKEKYREELKILARRLSLQGYVDFVGWQKNIPRVLSRLDVLVLPTISQEAFGRVLIEAGAYGVPVVATRVGGIVDIIDDGVNGLLVQPKSAADLASAIIRIAKDPKLSQKLVQAARKNVEENFTLTQMADKTIKVYEELRARFRILVIKLSALGDVILATPSLKALRKKFPQAHISVLLSQPYRLALENCPYINQIIEMPLKVKDYKDIWRFSSLLRKLDFDIVVDLQNSRKSHLLSYFSACNRRYGYANGKFSFLLNKKVKDVKICLSPIEHQARNLRLLGVSAIKEDVQLWPRDSDLVWAEEFLKNHRQDKTSPLIGINLGGSLNWPSKSWGVEKVALLVNKIHAAGMQALITGKGQDAKAVKGLKQFCQHSFIDAVDQTQILQLACLIKHCRAYVSSDSAPLHVAYAMKIPVVALFGPTDSRRHTVLGARQIIIRKKMDCSPCYKRRCRRHKCMQDIPAEEVFEALKLLLG